MAVNLELSPMEQRMAAVKALRRSRRIHAAVALVVELVSFVMLWWATHNAKLLAAMFIFAYARNLSNASGSLKFQLKQHELVLQQHADWHNKLAADAEASATAQHASKPTPMQNP